MAYKLNPFTGNFDLVGASGSGSSGAITINDGSVFSFMPKVATRLNTNTGDNRALRVLFVGDSLQAQGMQFYFRNALIGLIGDSGESYGWLSYTNLAGGATAGVTNDWLDTVTITLPPSGSVQFKRGTTSPVLGDTLKVAFIKESGAGTFKIESSINNGSSWSDEKTGISAANATTIGAVDGPTVKANPAQYVLRVTNTGVSGNVRLIGANISNSKTRGILPMTTARGGLSLSQMVTAPSAIVNPIIADFNPDLVVYLNTDSGADQTTYLSTLYSLVGHSTADWLFVGINPNDLAGDQSFAVQNAIIKAFAIAQGQSYFNSEFWGGSYARLNGAGLMADTIHLTQMGYSYLGSDVVFASPIPGLNGANLQNNSRSQFTSVNGSWNFLSPYGLASLTVIRGDQNAQSGIFLSNANGSTSSGFRAVVRAENDGTYPGSLFLGTPNNSLVFGANNKIGTGDLPPSGWGYLIGGGAMNANSGVLVGVGTIAPGDWSIANAVNGTSTVLGGIQKDGSYVSNAIGSTAKVKSGTNAKAGTFTLVAGTVVHANTSVTANSVIIVTLKTSGGTRVGNPDIVPSAGVGFTATGAATDTSTYNYIILEVN